MRNRRVAIAGLALVATIGLTGCGPNSTGESASGAGSTAAEQAKPADPAAELAAAATRLSEESLKFKMTMAAGLNAEGVANADGSQADMSMVMGGSTGQGITVAMRKIDDDVWVKYEGELGSMLGAKADKWMHIDSSKLPADSPFAMSGSNPKDASKMIAATTDVTKDGDRSYQGVLDMTKAPGTDAKSLAALGDKASAVPFTAAVDAEGRLVELVIDVESLAPGGGKMTTTYYDFGTDVSVKAPPAKDVVEMPKEMLGVGTA